jgi:peptidoglycan/LPS O-acetylase OafA/YrhL
MNSSSGPQATMWQSLRRVTSGGRYIPEIDGLRFVAILSVIFYHIALVADIRSGNRIPYSSLQVGGAAPAFYLGRGVQMFFAISGMILGLPFVAQHVHSGRAVHLKAYFLRRVTRLEPPYIINLLLLTPLVVVLKHLPAKVVILHLLASLFYVHWLIYGGFPIVHGPSWSLEVEVQFYLLAPLLALVFLRRSVWARRIGLLVAIIGFSVLQTHLSYGDGARLKLSLVCFVQYFLVGLLMADWFLKGFRKWKTTVIWDLVGIPILFALFAISNLLAAYLIPLMLIVLFISAFKGKLLNRFLRINFVATVGGMCYSIYLTHLLVIDACFALFAKFHIASTYRGLYVIGLVVTLPTILLTGAGFYMLIERPCMDRNWPNKLWQYIKSARFGTAGEVPHLPLQSEQAVQFSGENT